MNHLCATLLILCNTTVNMFFDDKRNDFVQEISTCAIEYNAYFTEPQNRIPVPLVVAISAHETGWGESRFAKEANNYFGIKTDSDDPDMYIVPKNNPNVKLSKYYTVCESVYAFMDLLIFDTRRYQDFVNELHNQWFLEEINYEKLIYTLHRYSDDPKWENQVLKIINRLEIR